MKEAVDSHDATAAVAALKARHTALWEDLDSRWLFDRPHPLKDPHGVPLPEACTGVDGGVGAFVREDSVLYHAVIQEQEMSNLWGIWGQRIELLEDLDRQLQTGCR